MSLLVEPLANAPFGARITLPHDVTDISQLSDEDFSILQTALETHLVLVVPNQQGLKPTSQKWLTQRFDKTTQDGAYGHEKDIFLHTNSVLAKDGKLIPHCPEVVRVGNAVWTAAELSAIETFESDVGVHLEHPQHHTFHKSLLTDEQTAAGYTRYFRWHIDAALYKKNPPKVTTLLGLYVPPSDRVQKVLYPDNVTTKDIAQGATAFASGAIAYELLSPEDKDFVLNHSVKYAPHPYIWIGNCKATSDGLTIVSEGKERDLDADLPPWCEADVQTFPLVWTNPTTGKPHLQVHACCPWKIVHSQTGQVVADTAEARVLCQKFLTPAIQPENVYAHAWQTGDLAIFFNRGVTHSVTSTFGEDEKRLMHQCNIASGDAPVNTNNTQ